MANKFKAYKKELEISYTSGAYATFELLKKRASDAECVYIHSDYRDDDGLSELCNALNVPLVQSDKAFSILNQKGNSYVLGVFRKYADALAVDEPHIVLVNPSDMGNLGTIIRTMAGLNLRNLAVIEPAADVWNPKTVRASMGSLFHIRQCVYASFDEYRTQYPLHTLFPFMLTGSIAPEDAPPCPLFTLIFGNEASGLCEAFAHIGQSVKIPLSTDLDSFNLSIAAGIGMYAFARNNNLV